MKDENFKKIANSLMEDIYSQIERQDLDYEIDIDYSNEVLNIEIENKVYVINKQSPKKEIWLASPLSGPYHFYLVDDLWVDKKNNSLKNILSVELSHLLNKKIEIL